MRFDPLAGKRLPRGEEINGGGRNRLEVGGDVLGLARAARHDQHRPPQALPRGRAENGERGPEDARRGRGFSLREAVDDSRHRLECSARVDEDTAGRGEVRPGARRRDSRMNGTGGIEMHTG